jgi:hypothetical protein
MPTWPVSAESQIVRYFKIGGISPYYLSLPPGSAIFRNWVSRIEHHFAWLEFAKINPCASIRWAFRKRFRKNLPPAVSIQRWFDDFENQICICKKKIGDRPRVSLNACTAAGHFCSNSKEICRREVVSFRCRNGCVCVAGSMQMGSHESI